MTGDILARCRILRHNELIEMLRQVLRETAFVVFFSIAALLLTIVTSGYGRATPLPSTAPYGADSLQQPVRYHIAYEVSF